MSICIQFNPQRIRTTPVNAPVAALPDGAKEALFKACKQGDLEAVEKWCLQYPDSVNVKDENGQTGLMVATLARKSNIVEYFVKTCPNFDINAEDINLRNALFHACISNDQNIGILLINNHIKIVIDKTGHYADGAFKTKSPNRTLLKRLNEAVFNQAMIEASLLDNILKKFDGANNDILINQAETTIGKKIVLISLAKLTEVTDQLKPPAFETKTDDIISKKSIKKIDPVSHAEVLKLVDPENIILRSPDTQLRVKAFVEEHPSLSRTAMIDAFKEETGIKIGKHAMQQYIKKYGVKTEETLD